MEVKDALEKLKEKGSDGSYPRGCVHDVDAVDFRAFDRHHAVRICPECLGDLLE
jgi:hypothetical protein